jgi:cystathionine beta-lyase/cystathionine gamma-synthase
MSDSLHNIPGPLSKITQLLHAMSEETDSAPPIAIGASTGHRYQRQTNETVAMLEHGLALLEGAEYGVCFDCGIGAIHHIIVGLAKPGQTIAFHQDLYWGTIRIEHICEQWGINVLRVDLTDPAARAEAMAQKPAMVFFEPISNPLLTVTDIAALAADAHQAGALLIADNTLMPTRCKPMELGVDIVVHSLTKYINGHGDALGGVVLCDDKDIHKTLLLSRESIGGVLNPFAAYLHIRGLKTLHLRMPEHERIAMTVAQHFDGHPGIKQVRYPGLPGDPHHALAARQFSGFGGVLTLAFKNVHPDWRGYFNMTGAFNLVRSMPSLGETETLCIFFNDYKPEPERTWIMRLAIGLEDPADIIADIEQGLARIALPNPEA